MQNKKSNAMDNDDADFNIKDVKQMLSPQKDTGNRDSFKNSQSKNDIDTESAGASISKKKWCC